MERADPLGAGTIPVIDAHVHAFDLDTIRDRDHIAQHDAWFGTLYRDPRAKLTSDIELRESMGEAGVARSLICGFPWSDPGRCRQHNDWMATVSAHSGGTLPWLATVVPHHAGAADEAARCFGLGASGLGELNMDGQGFDLAQPTAVAAVVEVCRAHDKPVLFHASEPIGHQYPGKGRATPERLLTFIEAYPDVDIVLAHWGGGLPFYELMPEVAQICARVRYDMAAAPYLYQHHILRAAIGIIGTDRILWGSDFPVLGQQRFLDRVRGTDLPPETLRRILSANAHATYALPDHLSPTGNQP